MFINSSVDTLLYIDTAVKCAVIKFRLPNYHTYINISPHIFVPIIITQNLNGI